MAKEMRTVVLDLSQKMHELDGRPIVQFAKMRESKNYENLTDKEFTDEMAKLSPIEQRKLAPIMTLGDGIIVVLSKCIKPKNNEEAAKLYTMITLINQKKQGDGKFSIIEQELDDIISLVESAKENLTAALNGQVLEKLRFVKAELTVNKKK